MPYKDKEKQREAQRRYERSKREERHAVWTLIFYPQDVPDWRDMLDELGLEILVSPEHNRDVWTERDEKKNPEHVAGELKVSHRHILARYPQPVGYSSVMKDFAELGVHTAKFARSYTAMALYLTHKKSPDKARYDEDAIVEFGGANYYEAIHEKMDVHTELKRMRAFIRENSITEFVDFWDWCDENADDWSYLLDTKCAWVIGQYIDRYRNAIRFEEAETKKKSDASIIDGITSEVEHRIADKKMS